MTLSLRPPTPADVDALHEMSLRPKVFHGTSRAPFTPREAFEQRLLGRGPDVHTIVADINDRAVGYGALYRGDGRRAHCASLAITVDDRWHRQGIGRALMTALLDLADNWLGLVRLELETNTDNDGAIRLYTACGFEHEGTKRAAVLRDGAYVDSLMMARIRPAPDPFSAPSADPGAPK